MICVCPNGMQAVAADEAPSEFDAPLELPHPDAQWRWLLVRCSIGWAARDEGEQAIAGFLEAVGDGGTAQPPIAQEGFAPFRTSSRVSAQIMSL